MSQRKKPQKEEKVKENTGSMDASEPVFIAIGHIRKPHGVQGEMSMDILTDFPERIQVGKTVYLGDTYEPVKIVGRRGHGGLLLIRLAGVNDKNEAETYRNKMIYVKRSSLPPLPEGEYYYHQLIGMKVYDEGENYLGILEEILETGANDVYLIRRDNEEILLPAIEANILKVQPDDHKMIVKLPEWQN